MRVVLAIAATALVVVPSTQAAPQASQAAKLRKSETVIRFFTGERHGWMIARRAGCKQVPWTRTCRIAREKLTQHRGVIREYHYAWADWLPSKWQRIGACETGYGERPGNWQHNSGTYQGAFGFHYDSWDQFRWRADRTAGPYPSEAYLATPRQQYEVALAIYRAYGLSGWGCRAA